jgi:hypothetical protein
VIAAVVTPEIKIILMPNSMLTGCIFSLNSPRRTKWASKSVYVNYVDPVLIINTAAYRVKGKRTCGSLRPPTSLV